jgi:hypothetical protein
MRLHHSYGFRHWLSGTLLRLWRELHQCDPVQLQLPLKSAAKKNISRGCHPPPFQSLKVPPQTCCITDSSRPIKGIYIMQESIEEPVRRAG